MALIGYARVSTADQNMALQLDALRKAGVDRVFRDQGVSGSASARPGLDSCLDHLREGDVLTVWKLDRLGRNTQHMLTVVDDGKHVLGVAPEAVKLPDGEDIPFAEVIETGVESGPG